MNPVITKNLREIHGIGPTVTQRLIEAFGSEKEALRRIRAGDAVRIGGIEGIGPRQAIRIIRTLHAMETGEDITNFLRTEDGIDLYEEITSKIARFANTPYTRARLSLLFPLTSNQLDEIEKRRTFSQDALELINDIQPSLSDIDAHLRIISPLKVQSRSNIYTGERAICITDEQLFNKISSGFLAKHCDIHFIQDAAEIQELTQSYPVVILIGDTETILEVDNLIELQPSALDNTFQILPESIISFYAHNKEIISSLIELCKIFGNFERKESDFVSFLLKNVNISSLEALDPIMEKIKPSGEIEESTDSELARVSKSYSELDKIVAEAEIEMNEQLSSEIQDTRLEIHGERLLNMLRVDEGTMGPDFREYIDENLFDKVESISEKLESKIAQELNLFDEELDLLIGLFPRTVSYPVEVDPERREYLERYLKRKLLIRSLNLKIEIAKALSEQEELCHEAVKGFLDLDYALMIGKFIQHYNLHFPRLNPNTLGIGFENCYNIGLIDKIGSVDPINYSFGSVELKESTLGDERIILLSGANSGGKTTLLLAIAHCAILSMMGLGVPASRAEIGVIDQLHFFRKPSGAVDAGAFETTLKMFSQILGKSGKGKRLVLADEMESISEPGASARVIAAFLDSLHQDENSTGVFVSHLANEIQKICQSGAIRVDGIEASGLDEQLQLIVDRSPKYYTYARSTPQLIVERLKKLSDNPREAEIFENILARFRDKEWASENLLVRTQVAQFAENFLKSDAYQELTTEKTGLESSTNVNQVLSLYIALVDQVFGARLHSRILVLIHGPKETWTRQELTQTIGATPASVLAAIHDLSNAGIISVKENGEISLLNRLF